MKPPRPKVLALRDLWRAWRDHSRAANQDLRVSPPPAALAA